MAVGPHPALHAAIGIEPARIVLACGVVRVIDLTSITKQVHHVVARITRAVTRPGPVLQGAVFIELGRIVIAARAGVVHHAPVAKQVDKLPAIGTYAVAVGPRPALALFITQGKSNGRRRQAQRISSALFHAAKQRQPGRRAHGVS